MSEIQTVTNFEFLPNEILMECFGYFNALQIFYSFDQLNSRFNKLIRRIPLYLDFQNFPRSICQRFCETILCDSKMKEYIYSLHLSNKDTSIWIRLFFTMFSLAEFPHLRSLTLTDVNLTNIDQLIPMLSSMPLLTCFHLRDSDIGLIDIISTLHCSVIRTLTLPHLPRDLTLLGGFLSLTSFTIDSCDKYQLLQVLNDKSTLKYLQINSLSRDAAKSDKVNLKFTHSLQHLVINKTDYQLYDIEMIIQHTPNLNVFILFADFQYNSLNDHECKRLLHTYLPHLKVFKFCFHYYYREHKLHMEEDLRAFQNNFQCYAYNSLIKYTLSYNKAVIYTVPYAFSTFELHSGMERYRHTAVDDGNTFSNVTQLTIHANPIETDDSLRYFSYDRSRRLSFDRESMLEFFTTNNIQSMISNFSHVKHLDVSHVFRFVSPSVLLEIVRETPQLSSLTMSYDILQSSLNDDELCQYLNRMIHKLCITTSWFPSYQHDILEKFCKVFSDIEQLTCTVKKRFQVMYLLTHLPKLIRVDFTVTKHDRYSETSWLDRGLRELGMNVHINYVGSHPEQVTVWINRVMTDN